MDNPLAFFTGIISGLAISLLIVIVTPDKELTVYTNEDIYYINTSEYKLTTETGRYALDFETFDDMSLWVEDMTAEDAYDNHCTTLETHFAMVNNWKIVATDYYDDGRACGFELWHGKSPNLWEIVYRETCPTH